MPDPGGNIPPCIMQIYKVNIATAASSQTSISTTVPGVWDACSISMLKQASQGKPTTNGYALQGLDDFQRIEYQFNDSSNSMVAFPIITREEANYNGRKSMAPPGQVSSESASLAGRQFVAPRSDTNFMLGLQFGELLNLSNQKFGFTLYSNDPAAAGGALLIYMWFRGQVAV
jgi:hypothetical protein